MAKAIRFEIGVGHFRCRKRAVELSAVFLMARYRPRPHSPGQRATSKRSKPRAVRTANSSALVKEDGVPRVS